MKKAGVLVLALLMMVPPLVFAESSEDASVMTGSKSGVCFQCPAEKLGRGMSNIVYSTLETPYRIGREMEVANPIAGFTSGLVKGVFWTVGRAVVGVIEVGTFLIPTRPLMHEFDAGWWTA
ncbi:MAG: hypothetical protein COV74_07890 [Candidatus Omnitrophica bacterium CG11_big_fil_rev_8_21_14_0_20_45_26]|uniref:Exosortase system-associated protein, TIGR04073 family n=1 Tax=Candidatus Abzuiibacterium crystallinum TaxID=1974748 RepID=A0A2H0LMM6_9BACT|nr:MAG: hypothetical protein COV74_07890 [Candidatus Omnitrophica bacterium CG11_big_fil_rev_8_21_14_0_20_45_26]PIW65142.1 MAG: hypothetical protein COW12_02930 [Candidatus Omnitrophica bacterium CG12_big_fil_rev_8_21_14_0_65_45_16]